MARYHPAYKQATVKLLSIKTQEKHELLQKLGQGARGVASPMEILREILQNAYPVQERLCHLLRHSS